MALIQQYREQIAVAILICYVLYLGSGGFFKSLAGLVPILGGMLKGTPATTTPVTPPPPAPPAIDDDTLDFQALKRLQVRFANNKCKDGTAAVDVCLTHFFHREA